MNHEEQAPRVYTRTYLLDIANHYKRRFYRLGKSHNFARIAYNDRYWTTPEPVLSKFTVTRNNVGIKKITRSSHVHDKGWPGVVSNRRGAQDTFSIL
jgi:hypothetical protein